MVFSLFLLGQLSTIGLTSYEQQISKNNIRLFLRLYRPGNRKQFCATAFFNLREG